MEVVRRNLVLLGKVADTATARILAARLAAEGIEAHIRSESTGPYTFTVGQMAVAELWVDEADLDDAREVMLAAEIDEALELADPAGSSSRAGWTWSERLLALALVAMLVTLVVRRFLIAVG